MNNLSSAKGLNENKDLLGLEDLAGLLALSLKYLLAELALNNNRCLFCKDCQFESLYKKLGSF